MADHPLRPATRLRLGRPLPYQLPDRTQAPPEAAGPVSRVPTFIPTDRSPSGHMGYYPRFREAIPLFGAGYLRVTHPFAAIPLRAKPQTGSLDLHALSTPPAFTLSQDQTLQKTWFYSNPGFSDGDFPNCQRARNLLPILFAFRKNRSRKDSLRCSAPQLLSKERLPKAISNYIRNSYLVKRFSAKISRNFWPSIRPTIISHSTIQRATLTGTPILSIPKKKSREI